VDDRLKRRLIGAAVLVSLVVIFVPMLVEDEPDPVEGVPGGAIPPRENLTFKSQVLKDEIAVPTDAPPPDANPEPDAAPPAAAVAVAPAPEVTPTTEEPAPLPAPVPASAEAVPKEPTEKPTPEQTQVAKATPPAPKAPAAPARKITTWILQIGNYASREKADGVARQLRSKGLEVFVEPIGTPPVFRVAVGPESNRRQAGALIPRIQSALPGSSKPFIRSYP
jgi:DedD protein